MGTLKNTFAIAVLFVIVITFTSGAQPKPNPPVAKNQKEGKVYVMVQKNPEFPGGFKAFGKYLGDNIKYPALDKKNKLQGKVYVSFIVEPDGKLTNISAIRSPSANMTAEAIRVMKLSPSWQPGKQGGKPVRTKYTVPISFTLGA